MRPVWYGDKTFEITKSFMHQGIQVYEGNLFTCNRETYQDLKKYLSEEEVIAKIAKPEVIKPLIKAEKLSKPKKTIKKQVNKKRKFFKK